MGVGSGAELRFQGAGLGDGKEVASGSDYRFERLCTRRWVGDAVDPGEIDLLTYAYRPVRSGPLQVALMLHGSTGGLRRDPAEPSAPAESVVNYVISRGFTLLVPMRRGVDGSGGTYIAECDLANDPECTRDRYIDIAGPALEDAVADTLAVIDDLVLGSQNLAGAKVLLVGQSRGGTLALAVAAARPQQISGVVAFAGGWLRIGASLTSKVNARSKAFMLERLTGFARRNAGETLWLHGASDSFYSPEVTRGFFDAYCEAGGRGKYVFIDDHPQPDGHQIIRLSVLWRAHVDNYLRAQGFEVDPSAPAAL
jgi:pimeloyl-ACP methyl ester carboxylesterase